MIQLDIDTSSISSQFDLSRTEIDNLLSYTVQEVTAEYAYIWGNIAKRKLKSTRNRYIGAIQISSRGRFTGVAMLNPAAWLPNAIEVGASAFDMKAGFLNSSKVKTGKNGPYLTIPFRYASAGSVGESDAFAGVLPPSVQRAADLAGSSGVSLSSISSKYHIPKSASVRQKSQSASFEQIKNKQSTSQYEGLQKTQGGYITFRRVSLNSDPGSFQHPGFTARNFSQEALSNLDIPSVIGESIDVFLTNKGF